MSKWGSSVFLIVFLLIILCVGCASNHGEAPQTGGFIVAYDRPLDFKHFEVYVGLATGFPVTGHDGENWITEPNATKDWNGSDNTLHTITAATPIVVSNLTPGVMYYVKIVAVDKSNQRSAPSEELNVVAGDSQRSSTLVVAASDASPASKAGADYVCDGVSDQETINEAITSLTAGRIVLTEGTFIVDDSIVIGSNIKVQGQGMSTIIKFKDNINANMSMVKNSNFYDPDQTPNDNIEVSDLKLDGNAANNSSGTQNGLYFKYLNNVTITNVTAEKFRDYGFLVAYCSNGAIKNNCMAKECGAFGIYIYKSNYITASSFIAENNTGHGVCIAYSDSCIFTQSIISGNDYGIWVNSSINTIITNNQVLLNQKDGVRLEYNSDDSTVSANNVSQNSQLTNNTYSNILVRADCNRVSVQQNVCREGNLDNKPKYGIAIGSPCYYTIISSNDCYLGGETAGISNAGTNTSFGAGNRNNNGTWSTTPN